MLLASNTHPEDINVSCNLEYFEISHVVTIIRRKSYNFSAHTNKHAPQISHHFHSAISTIRLFYIAVDYI